MIPGEYILKQEDIVANEGKKTVMVAVTNTGDRPVQIGSHFHFFEVNKQMSFNREDSFGMRLNLPSGLAVRFEPSEEKLVELVEIGGSRIVYGFSGLVNGALTTDTKYSALIKAKEQKFTTTNNQPL